MGFHVSPPLVLRKISSPGLPRSIVLTMTVRGCCESTETAWYPNLSVAVGFNGVMLLHRPLIDLNFQTAPLLIPFGPGASPKVR